MASYLSYNGLKCSNGNRKLGNDTIILNMGSGTHCPSKALGLCALNGKCYALKAERLYPEVLPCRMAQANYWQAVTTEQLIVDFDGMLKRHKTIAKRIKWLRFNEAGDFYGQADIDKLDALARHLFKTYKIKTYGYSARADLDFSQAFFACKGSGHDNGNNGKTMAFKFTKQEVKGIKGNPKMLPFQYNADKFKVCPMDCKICSACKVKNHVNICFPLH